MESFGGNMPMDDYVKEFDRLFRAIENADQFLSILNESFWQNGPKTMGELTKVFVFVKGTLSANSPEEKLCNRLIGVLEHRPTGMISPEWFFTRALEVVGFGSQSATLVEEFVENVRHKFFGQIGLVVILALASQGAHTHRRVMPRERTLDEKLIDAFTP